MDNMYEYRWIGLRMDMYQYVWIICTNIDGSVYEWICINMYG